MSNMMKYFLQRRLAQAGRLYMLENEDLKGLPFPFTSELKREMLKLQRK